MRGKFPCSGDARNCRPENERTDSCPQRRGRPLPAGLHGSPDTTHHAPTDSTSPPDTTCYDAGQDEPPSLPCPYPAAAARQYQNIPSCLIDDISPANHVALECTVSRVQGVEF